MKKFKCDATKREALQAISSIYDPLGLLNPVVVKFKVFLKKICAIKIDWDEKLTGDLLTEWNELIQNLFGIDEIKFDRNYCFTDRNDPFVKVELHGFSDASEKCYGCCVYLRFVHKSGLIKIALVTARSRVSPLKKLMVPKLELLGTLLLSRLLPKIEECFATIFDISTVFAWRDSSMAHSWIINCEKTYPAFVENRVLEIRKNLDVNCWHLIKSKDNPADIVSRGSTHIDLLENSPFLTLQESEWPMLTVGDSFTCLINNNTEVDADVSCGNGANLSVTVDCT